MKTIYETIILGFGNHAAIEIPEKNLQEIGGNKRAPLKVTVKGYTYQSTATGMDGKCLVVFPTKDRIASGVKAGDKVMVTLELDSGYREVNVPYELKSELKKNNLTAKFKELNYSRRKEYVRLITDAKTPETKNRRLEKIMIELLER